MKKFATVVAAVIGVIGLFGASAPAAAQDRLAVVTAAAPIYLVPDVRRIPLRTVEVREYLSIRKKEGEWLRVDFQDLQFGLRTGYIQTRFVNLIPVERDEQSYLVTVDLGLKAPIPRSAATSSLAADSEGGAVSEREKSKRRK